MKMTFFKFGLFLTLGVTTAVFYSCRKGDDDNGGNISAITAANVINGSTRITAVKALVHRKISDYDEEEYVIAQASYINDGFTLELPETLPSEYLEAIDEENDMTGIVISDRNVKANMLDDINGYDKDENEIGWFYLEEEINDVEYYISWMYVDRDVTFKGEHKDMYDDGYEGIEKIDLDLKKGWNIVYDSYTDSYNNSTGRETYTLTLTSQKPSGANYSWNFYNYYDSRSAESTVKSKPVENKKSVFTKLKENRKKRH